MNKDLNHLKVLGIIHTIWGVLAILFGLVFGLLFVAVCASPNVVISGNLSPSDAHQLFLWIGIVVSVLTSIYVILRMLAGGILRKQRGYGFCSWITMLAPC